MLPESAMSVEEKMAIGGRRKYLRVMKKGYVQVT
jgi:hypothetical protein